MNANRLLDLLLLAVVIYVKITSCHFWNTGNSYPYHWKGIEIAAPHAPYEGWSTVKLKKGDRVLMEHVTSADKRANNRWTVIRMEKGA